MTRTLIAMVAALTLLTPAAAVALTAPSAAVVDVCGKPAPGLARCYAELRTDVHGGGGVRGPLAHTALPQGLGPADLHEAYRLPTTGGANQTVAVVDAGDAPTAEADLATYRSTYGLPACTTANGCFRKVNQAGTATPTPADQGWGVEISLDLDMVSAACPDCHILLVEGNTAALADLAAAENTAANLGATEISNSYGADERNGMDASAYRHPGIAIVASSGDSGYGAPPMPAVFANVIAVGGTSLSRSADARGWTEQAWSRAGSGCSAWVDKPNWQRDPNCPGRMGSDVAAVADPRTGVAVYDGQDQRGWIVVGGTSAAAPLIAGIIGLAGNPASYPDASAFYRHATELNDVVGGSNASDVMDCGGDYQCTAVPGYDGPTGNGTPNGLAAF